jgi:hypothetical protein
MLKNKSQLIVGALLAFGVLSESYGDPLNLGTALSESYGDPLNLGTASQDFLPSPSPIAAKLPIWDKVITAVDIARKAKLAQIQAQVGALKAQVGTLEAKEEAEDFAAWRGAMAVIEQKVADLYGIESLPQKILRQWQEAADLAKTDPEKAARWWQEELNWNLHEVAFAATDESSIPELEALLAAGAQFNKIFDDNRYPRVRCPAVLKWLLDRGLGRHINQQGIFGWTPLHAAVFSAISAAQSAAELGNEFSNKTALDLINVLLILLKYGANPLGLDDLGQTVRQLGEADIAFTLKRREPADREALLSKVGASWEAIIRLLKEAEENVRTANPAVDREARDALRARPAVLRAKLEANERPEEQQVLREEIEKVQRALATMDRAEKQSQKGWFGKTKDYVRSFF